MTAGCSLEVEELRGCWCLGSLALDQQKQQNRWKQRAIGRLGSCRSNPLGSSAGHLHTCISIPQRANPHRIVFSSTEFVATNNINLQRYANADVNYLPWPNPDISTPTWRSAVGRISPGSSAACGLGAVLRLETLIRARQHAAAASIECVHSRLSAPAEWHPIPHPACARRPLPLANNWCRAQQPATPALPAPPASQHPHPSCQALPNTTTTTPPRQQPGSPSTPTWVNLFSPSCAPPRCAYQRHRRAPQPCRALLATATIGHLRPCHFQYGKASRGWGTPGRQSYGFGVLGRRSPAAKPCHAATCQGASARLNARQRRHENSGRRAAVSPDRAPPVLDFSRSVLTSILTRP